MKSDKSQVARRLVNKKRRSGYYPHGKRRMIMSENIFELTPEEEFKMKFERYFPEFFENLKNDTLDSNDELKRKTADMSVLARKAGYVLKDYTMKYIREFGYDKQL